MFLGRASVRAKLLDNGPVCDGRKTNETQFKILGNTLLLLIVVHNPRTTFKNIKKQKCCHGAIELQVAQNATKDIKVSLKCQIRYIHLNWVEPNI